MFAIIPDFKTGTWLINPQLWQTAFIASVVGWTLVREWSWTHTVFFVLHGLVMLMKQHSYAFYNGHLSTVYRQRELIASKIKQLEQLEPTRGPSSTHPPVSDLHTSHLDKPPSAQERRHSIQANTSVEKSDIDRIARAIASKNPLDDEQIDVFYRIMKWELDALSDELRGTAADASYAYPANLGFIDHFAWIPFPTLVYEIEYPRTQSIEWPYVAEKVVAMIGVIFVMIQVSQYSICIFIQLLCSRSFTNSCIQTQW
jgi:sterol O-acyltransferase